MNSTHKPQQARRVTKLFACFIHQVRHGLGRWEGAGPCVVRAEDELLQIRPGPDMPLISIRPHLVAGFEGFDCFIHCREGADAANSEGTLVAVYRYGITGQVHRHPAGDGASLGVLSDSYVAVEIARTLIAEALGRSRKRRAVARPEAHHAIDRATGASHP